VNKAGRNNTGRVTFRTHGTRVRKRVRIIDHDKKVYNTPGIVARIEYDPNRSAFISLLVYANGVCAYSLSAHNTHVGSVTTSYHTEITSFYNQGTGFTSNLLLGDSCDLEHIPRGSVIFDVERLPNTCGSMARAAGTFCIAMKKYINIRRCLLQIPSKKLLSFPYYSRGTKGVSSNAYRYREQYGNAGHNRRIGYKPVVRGVAKNPVDHLHGGGEGKRSKDCFPKTAWGKMLH
jgi:large subunit ribosomal protein L2